MEESFCLLKSEAYLLGKSGLIARRIEQSGLTVTGHWTVRLHLSDVLRLYQGCAARTASLFRLPPLFALDMWLLEGPEAIARMHDLKYRLREELWGFAFRKGGFVHAPDSPEEARRHKAILAARRIGSAATTPVP